jgi:pimeloyl-ACP methyl ester carboxylesterase
MESENLSAALRVIAAVLLGVPLLVYLLQEKLIFFPQPLDAAQVDAIAGRAPKGKSLYVKAPDGTRLHAWYVEPPPGGPIVVYFGGNGEGVSWMLGEAGREVPRAGWLLVDYRGYGASEGSPSEAALVADALVWYDHAARELGARRIYLLGRSLGSGVAVQLAAARPVTGLILVTPFDSLVEVAKRHYPFLPVSLLLKHRFDSVTRAPDIRAPLLCMTASRDLIVPPQHAQRLYAAWGGPKRWISLEEAGHNTIDAHPLYWRSIAAFLDERPS